jgi:hypothetical protein
MSKSTGFLHDSPNPGAAVLSLIGQVRTTLAGRAVTPERSIKIRNARGFGTPFQSYQ